MKARARRFDAGMEFERDDRSEALHLPPGDGVAVVFRQPGIEHARHPFLVVAHLPATSSALSQ